MRLIDVRTSDGSRYFACLPKSVDWGILRDHLARLEGVEIVALNNHWEPKARLDFNYRGHSFSTHNGGDEFCFFVRDPQCPDLDLYRLASHCEKLLENA